MYLAVGSPGTRLVRVAWMLEELGQPYRIVKAAQGSEEMRRHHPSGKGPVLVGGGATIADSAAICAWLADRHPEKEMAPKTPAERAHLNAWLYFAQSELEAPSRPGAKPASAPPVVERADVGPWTTTEFNREINALDSRLAESGFAMGNRFTAADVILGHCGQWARNSQIAITSERVNAYFSRVLARPALARARAREAAVE